MFIQRRKKRFDEEGDEDLPPKNRPFKLKTAQPDPPPEPTPPPSPRPTPPPKPPKPPPQPTPKPLAMLTDEEGLDRAYASDTNLYLDEAGTLFVSGSKGGPLDNDWMENYRDFGGGLLKKFETTAEKMATGDAVGAFKTLANPTQFDVSQEARYKEVDAFMKANPGKVKNMVGHSKGSAVIDQYMREHPDFKGKARIYSTPSDDLAGREKIKDFLNTTRQERDDYYKDRPWFQRAVNAVQDKEQDFLEWATGLDQVKGSKERGITRIANTGDFAGILDSSADRYTHGNPFKYLSGGGPHDYHEGIAQYNAGFNEAKTDRPGGFDTGYRMPFNQTPMTQTKNVGTTISAS